MGENNHVLVTGGTGFLGSYIIRYLLRNGKKVSAIRRANSPMELVADVADQVIWHETDLLDIIGLEKAMQGIDQVYHSAAMIAFEPKKFKAMHVVNVEGTANVVNLCLHVGVKKLLHVSSIAALGKGEKGAAVDESAKWEETKTTSTYSITKYLAELEAWRGQAEGLDVVVVNPSVIMGSGFWNTGTSRMFSYIWKGMRFNPSGCNGFVDVRDVARMTCLLMDSDVSGERFILSGENSELSTVFAQIAKALSKPEPYIKIRPWMATLGWSASWVISRLTGRPPFLTREESNHASTRHQYNNQKSLDTLGVNYTPLAETVRETGKQFLDAMKKNSPMGILNIKI